MNDDARAGLHNQASEREPEAPSVIAGDDARAGDFPGVERRVRDRALDRNEREDARIATRRFVLQGHRVVFVRE